MRWLRPAVLVATVGVIVAGYWGIAVDREMSGPVVPLGAVVDVPGGQMRVDRVIPWTDGGHEMPGMKIPDPVEKGRKRFWVNVTLRGMEGTRGITYRPASFVVQGQGQPPVTPHAASRGIDRVSPGALASVQLLFDVSEKAAAFELKFSGVARSVALDAVAAAGGHDEMSKPPAKVGGR